MTNLATAQREAAAGMQLAIEFAERHVAGWRQEALAWLISYARDHLEFISEQVSEYARSKGLPEPSPRAWGPVFLTAIKRGIIVKIGYAPSPRRHCSPTPLYRSQSYWSAE